MHETTQDGIEYGIGVFCGKLANHFTFHWGWTVLTTTLHEDLNSLNICGTKSKEMEQTFDDQTTFFFRKAYGFRYN
jgi:hypothetical protein